MGIIIHLYSI